MAYIVTEACVKCKYMDCVEICPVLCFHEGANMLVIDPLECIDCGACVDECPVQAIYPDYELPDEYREYVVINKKYAAEWPVIEQKGEPPEDREAWKAVKEKKHLISPEPGGEMV